MKNLKDYIVSLNPYNIFIMIKPEFLKKAKAILDIFLNDGYTIAKYGCRRLSYEEAAELYKMHKDEPYYDELCKYTCSGLSIGYCLNYTGTEDPIKHTDAIKDNVRNTFGKDQMKNALHSSDSIENVRRESKLYFKQV